MLMLRTLLAPIACLLITLIGRSQSAVENTPRALDSLEAIYKLRPFHMQNQRLFPQQYSHHSGRLPLQPSPNGTAASSATVCYDTSARFFWTNDTFRYYINSPFKLLDGNLLLVGEYQRIAPPYNGSAIVLKTDLNGNLLWGKRYDSVNNAIYNTTYYYNTLELLDGALLLAGKTNNAVSGNQDLLFTKIDQLGNIIWSKTYKSRFWGNGSGSVDYFYVQQMKQDPQSGDIYFTGPFWSDGKGLIRMNASNGNIIWSKAYNAGSAFDHPFGLDIRPQAIRVFAKALNSAQNRADISIYQINKSNGDTINTRFLTSNDTNNIKTNFLGTEPLQVANDGHYLLAGKCFGQYQYQWNGLTPLFQGAIAEFDTSLNFVKAYSFNNYIESNGYNTRVTAYPDKTGLFSMLDYISGYTADVHTIHFNNGQIQKQRRRQYQGEGIPFEPLATQLPNGGSMTIKLVGDSASNQSKAAFLKMYPSDTSSACVGFNSNASYIYSFGYIPSTYNQAGYVQGNVFAESVNKTFTSTPITVNLDPGCFQVSHCDTFKLRSASNTICVSQNLPVTVHKNPQCGSNIIWQYPANVVSSAQQINDTVFNFHFSAPWSGYIYGSVQGCGIIRDSILIQVLQAPASLNLGPDTSICPNNTIILNARSGYASYIWQNGSTDSLFTVSGPGIYSVQTTDACGGVFNDTVIVLPRPPVSVSIGPDRTKCNNDTLQLQAPSGFLNYNWQPNYNISATNSQFVTVNPSVDTTYYLKAEKTPGCFGFDTIHITVHRSPLIDLGNDTSICANQSVSLNAGPGFANYLWSNGNTNQQITINQVGTYHIMATTTQGCSSKDTLRLLTVHPLPMVALNKNPELCIGSSRVLDAGPFATYSWQDGSTNRTYTATTIGAYHVTVTDTNSCTSSDTTRINTLLPLPQNFLPTDTAICNYGTISLAALSPFVSYQWSNGANKATTVIDKPGIYWLEVKDGKGCTGRDSLAVLLKQCLKGLFVPNAFTPDGNGKNDRLKALLFGDIKYFEFSIYNRYGQRVFYTNNTNSGWDGFFNGKAQEAGTYIWQCRYELAGDPPALQQGSTILIR
jgi:gliding motility-associated-like protein